MEKDLNQLCIDFQTKDRKHRPNYKNPDGFDPCPFCGAVPHIRVEDDEGNCHDYDPDYEKDPWSGLWYVIEHTRDYSRRNPLKNTGDIPSSRDCLIATEGFQWYGFGSVPLVGGDRATFKTRKAAVAWWNKMVAKAKRMTKAEENVVQWACNLAAAVVAGDYKLPMPMNVAINSLQDAVYDLAKERKWDTAEDGCSKEFLDAEKSYWREVEDKLRTGQ